MSDDEDPGEEGEGGGYPYGEYEGGRDENLDRHGWGSALLPNNDIYEGLYFHGTRQGKGMYVFRGGARYDGEWRKNLKSGVGEFIYPDGSRYYGDWRKDLKHGYGVYYYTNGDTYEGAWYRGKRSGLGTYTYSKDGTKFIGTWKEGRQTGPAKVIYPRHVYHGPWELNMQKGVGCFTFDLKVMQHGFYVNMRDPKFDYVEEEEHEPVPEENPEGPEDAVEQLPPLPKGVIPIWRARYITEYRPELLPDEPVPIPVKDSIESLILIPMPEPLPVTPPEFDAMSLDEEGLPRIIYDDPYGTGKGLAPDTLFAYTVRGPIETDQSDAD